MHLKKRCVFVWRRFLLARATYICHAVLISSRFFGQKGKTQVKPLSVQLTFIVVPCAFSGAPRSDVINVVLCQQAILFLGLCKAKRFALAKRLPPSTPSRLRISIQNPDALTRLRGFVVPLAGLEPARYFYRGILSNYRNGVVKSFAGKIRENRGQKRVFEGKIR